MWERIKPILADDGTFYALLLLVIGLTAFGLGRWSIAPETSTNQPASIIFSDERGGQSADGEYSDFDESARDTGSLTGRCVGSINSDKYHLPYCSGAQRIKEENKVWFASKEDAESQGYAPAGNCPGI